MVHVVVVDSCHPASCAPFTQSALPSMEASWSPQVHASSASAEVCNPHAACSLVGRLGPCRFMQAAPGQLRTPSFPSMIIKQALEAGAGVTVKILNYHKNGSAMWNQLAVVPLRSADGSVTHHVGMQVGQGFLWLYSCSPMPSRAVNHIHWQSQHSHSKDLAPFCHKKLYARTVRQPPLSSFNSNTGSSSSMAPLSSAAGLPGLQDRLRMLFWWWLALGCCCHRVLAAADIFAF